MDVLICTSTSRLSAAMLQLGILDGLGCPESRTPKVHKATQQGLLGTKGAIGPYWCVLGRLGGTGLCD